MKIASIKRKTPLTYGDLELGDFFKFADDGSRQDLLMKVGFYVGVNSSPTEFGFVSLEKAENGIVFPDISQSARGEDRVVRYQQTEDLKVKEVK